MKTRLVSKLIFKIYNPKALRTELHTDALALGISGMLLQRDGENELLRLVYAVSQCTTEAESRYHSSKLELKEITWSLGRLTPFLVGIKFTIATDCECLIYINAWKTKISQIARCMGEISEYDLEIVHRPGTKMQHVDALSRALVCGEYYAGAKVMSVNTSENEVLIFQRSDPDFAYVLDILRREESERSKWEREKVKGFVLRDGLLYRKIVRDGEELELFAVPRAMRKSLVVRFHYGMSHFGIEKTVKMIGCYYYFLRMRSYVRVYVKNCPACILSGKWGRKRRSCTR